MERKKGAAQRPSRSIPRQERPRIVVAPRVYMDIVTPSTGLPAVDPKSKKSSVQPTTQPASQSVQYFDMKPLRAPSKTVHRTAPTLKPISKSLVSPVVTIPQVMQPAVEPAPASIPEPVAPQPIAKLTFEPPAKPVATIKKRKHLSLHRKPTKHHVIHGMAALLFIAGIYTAAYGWFAHQAVEQQASVLGARIQREALVQDNISIDRSVLSERLPTGVSGYKVPADLPRVIHIPSLAVVAPVLHLDALADGSPAAPKNIYETGWYKTSALPTDDDGAMLINGHVSGPTKHGVFYGLKNLKSGTEIVMERGDRRMMTFVVKAVENIGTDKVDMTKLLKSIEPGKLGLNLITSTGELDTSSNTDKTRVVVYAVQK